MIYLRSFKNEAAYSAYTQSEDYITPNLSLIEEEKRVVLNRYVEPEPEHDYSLDYLTFVSTSDNNTIGWKASYSLYRTISISTDDGQTWTDKTSDANGVTLATLNTGDKMLIKGRNDYYETGGGGYNCFTTTNTINVQGNIMSLIYSDNFMEKTTFPKDATYIFSYLFFSTKIVNAKNLILPATTLVYGCYQGLFNSCNNLITPPTLSATTLAYNCYSYMFYGCFSLTTPPALPATTLAASCYYCMFRNCTSLTISPTLPATTLKSECYLAMFLGCTNLTKIICLATNISASDCTKNWVDGVAVSGTFIKDSSMSNWSTGTSGIPSGWTVQDYAG